MFSDKTTATSKSIEGGLYPNHVVLMNVLAKYRRWLIEIGNSVVGLLPVRVGSDLKDTCSVHERHSSA